MPRIPSNLPIQDLIYRMNQRSNALLAEHILELLDTRGVEAARARCRMEMLAGDAIDETEQLEHNPAYQPNIKSGAELDQLIHGHVPYTQRARNWVNLKWLGLNNIINRLP